MGTEGKGTSKPQAASGPAADVPRSGSKPRHIGRRLILTFLGETAPQLHNVEFRYDSSCRSEPIGKETRNYFTWTAVPQALSLLVLDYVHHDLRKRRDKFFFRGARTKSLAASFCYALYQNSSFIHDLFTQRPGTGGVKPCLDDVIDGINLGGNEDRDRALFIKSDFLPPDCVEIFWNIQGEKPLTKAADVKRLSDQIRLSLKEPMPEEQAEAENTRHDPPPAQPDSSRQTDPPKFGKWLANEIREMFTDLQDRPKAKPDSDKPPASSPKESIVWEFKPGSEAAQPVNDPSASASPKASKHEGKTPIDSKKKPPPRPIDPKLFEIQNPDELIWYDNDGLLNFGNDDSDVDVWRIRDASEGVLIFGAVGSGKTSGSGAALGKAFLKMGYGGLVLTAKPDEGKRWVDLCARLGRAEDCIHVTIGSGHALNVMQYESQRPGKRFAVCSNLIGLFRLLIDTMSKNPNSGVRADFWTHATNELMGAIFNIFLIAGEPLVMDNLVRFINFAPLSPTKAWQEIEFFGEVVLRAEANAKNGTEEDQDVFQRAFEYWTVAFPAKTDATRSGIIIGFTAMASNMNDRGIYEMISRETNLTPEMILSGKIVILDIDLKGNKQGGYMVQSAWKLLFQQAIERRADKGLETAR